ncbi:hypothetical protein WJX72_007696 [[Myrmecia] bisecta]|uniref:Uncharacterized protein n=1 Tax=[Myrmecia] bisecta TaxID=41462 RepID=A0AAW1PU57_9CHLO
MAVIDTAIVGRLGTIQLGAVGLSNLVFFFCTVFFSFLLVVVTPKVANAVANNDNKLASESTAHALWVALICGVGLTVALFLGAPGLVAAFGTEPAIAAQAVPHLRMRSLAAPAVILMYVATGAFRGFKDTRTPLFAGTAQNLVNFSLDLFLVFGLGMGVLGAATAATAANYIGLAVMLVMLVRKNVLDVGDLRSLPTAAEVRPMAVAGFALAFCIGSVMTAVVSATTMATAMGAATLAAHTIVKQIIDFCNNIFGTFSTVAQTLVAASLGRDNKAEARNMMGRLLQLGITAGSIVAALLLLGQSQLASLFTTDPAVLTQTQRVLPLVACILPFAPCATTLEGTLLGAFNITHVAMRTVVSAVVSCSWLYLVAPRYDLGLLGVWVGVVLLVLTNCLCDAWKLNSRWSPLADEDDRP